MELSLSPLDVAALDQTARSAEAPNTVRVFAFQSIACECGSALMRISLDCTSGEPRHYGLFCQNQKCRHYLKLWKDPEVCLEPIDPETVPRGLAGGVR